MDKITVTKTSEDTIEAPDANGNVQQWWTRVAYMNKMQLSKNSLNAPYHHVRDGKAEQFKFFSISFFRPI